MKKTVLFNKVVASIIAFTFIAAAVFATISASADEGVASATSVDGFTLVDGSDLVIENGMVLNISAGSKAYYVLDAFEESCFIRDNDGAFVGKNSLLGTGYTLSSLASDDTLKIIVNGDLDGDALVTAKDVIRAKKYIEGAAYAGDMMIAMDYNGDGKLTSDDVRLMSSYAISEKTPAPDIELVEVPLLQREPKDLGTDFYATIDLVYTDNSLMASYTGHNSVVAYNKNLSAEQTWHFTRNSDGTYLIKNLAYGKVLDLNGGPELNMDVKVYKESGSEGQSWFIVDSTDGGYVLFPKSAKNLSLNVDGASDANNANVALYEFSESVAQRFLISKISLDTSKNYLDIVSKSDLGDVFYATISAGGKRINYRDSNVALYTIKNQPGEMWRFERQADGSYFIKNMDQINKALDVSGAAAANLTNVQLYNGNRSAAQLWNLYIKDGKVILSSALSKQFVLDIYAGEFNHAQNVDIYTFNDSEAQKFTLENMTGSYTPVLPKNKTYNILFIGNSFTWYHGLGGEIFAPLCAAAGYSVNVKVIEHGGALLANYVGSGKYAAEITSALNATKYDYVILQEQSTTPIYNPSTFYSASRSLAALVRSYGAQVVFYQTWGFHPSHGTTAALGGTVAMEKMLRNAYDNIGYEIGGIMAHVGRAFTDVYQAHGSNINLHLAADLYHPSTNGSTLAAYTIFASIFRVDPRTVNYNGKATDANIAGILRQAAYFATFEK